MGGAGSSCTSQRYAPDERSISLRHVNNREENGEYSSVRVMALKNHARQANSYIPQDELSSHLISRVKSFNADSYHKSKGTTGERPQGIRIAKSKTAEEEGVPTQQDDATSDIKTIVSESSDKVSAINSIPAVFSPLNNLATFKKTIELTITLGNDHGWAQVMQSSLPSLLARNE